MLELLMVMLVRRWRHWGGGRSGIRIVVEMRALETSAIKSVIYWELCAHDHLCTCITIEILSSIDIILGTLSMYTCSKRSHFQLPPDLVAILSKWW